MKNKNFLLQIDKKTGYIKSLSSPNDKYKMNWCGKLGCWGKIKTPNNHISTKYFDNLQIDCQEFSESFTIYTYSNNRVRITVKRFFNESGNLVEQYVIKNITNTVICLSRDNFGIELPFNDIYTFADDCMTNHCNTHIWCGFNSSWINALRMGDSNINLGLILTKGSFVSYSQEQVDTNIRGVFILEPENVLLNSNDEYTIEWVLLWHKGKKDFAKLLENYKSQIKINAKHYTVFQNEKIRFRIKSYNNEKPIVTLEHKEIDVLEHSGKYYVSYKPKHCKEHKFIIKCGNNITYAEFNVKPLFKELVEKRVNFIVDYQQCLDKESPLYGAYLIYDNATDSQYFDFYNTDHNACRERLNMAFTIIRYLQLKDDSKIRHSLDLFMNFLFREIYDEQTGEVFNNIGKNQDAIRLYNAPGVMLLFAEMYQLTAQDKYLDNIIQLAHTYYRIHGEKCYSNAIAIRKVINAFEKANRTKDKEIMLSYFNLHVNNMISNKTSYPKHEVNYEQTIVTSATNCISEMGLFSSNKKHYIKNAKIHLECLDRFSGNQPSFHLNEIAIRFWDDYWFGKSRKFGDTLPHHLSCLTARVFISYARLTLKKEYIKRAEECIRNCLCLIDNSFKGSAAYVYPHLVNGESGEFYDLWANDQDLPLYDGMNFCDLIKCFDFGKNSKTIKE